MPTHTTPTASTHPDLALPAFAAFAGQSALITGGAGFIGSHLAHALFALGAKVTILDDLSGGFEANLPLNAPGPGSCRLVRASILDDAELRRAIAGCRFVFHQAAMVSVPLSVERSDECMRVNVLGTERVLAAAKDARVQRVMFAASAAAYGNPTADQLPCRESQLPDPFSPYAMSKIAGEHLLTTFFRCYGLECTALRYFNIFGERQDPNSPYAAVISAFVNRLAAKKTATVFGDGLQTRDFTYVANVVRANLLAALATGPSAQGAVINIGTGSRTSLLDVLNHLGRLLNADPTPTFAPPRAGDVRDSLADISRARQLLGYAPIVDFALGIERMLRAMNLVR